MKYEYSVQIAWSKEDGAYLATIQELPGCMADGQTVEEALANVRQIAKEWIETAESESRAVPQPWSLEDYLDANRKSQENLQVSIQNVVSQTVSEVMRKLPPQEVGSKTRFEFQFPSGDLHPVADR